MPETLEKPPAISEPAIEAEGTRIIRSTSGAIAFTLIKSIILILGACSWSIWISAASKEDPGVWRGTVIALGLLSVVFVWGELHRAICRIEIDDDYLTVKTLLGGSRTVAIADIQADFLGQDFDWETTLTSGRPTPRPSLTIVTPARTITIPDAMFAVSFLQDLRDEVAPRYKKTVGSPVSEVRPTM